MRRVVLVVLGAVVLFASGCRDRKGKSNATAGDSIPMANAATPQDSLGRPIGRVRRTEQLWGRMDINGSTQLQQADLMPQPANFPVPFTTYKPADMQTASAKVGSMLSLTLTPMFNGKSVPEAFLQVQFDTVSLPAKDPAGATLAAFREGLKASALSVTPLPRYGSSLGAKSFRQTIGGKEFAGSVIVGKHGSQTYRVLVQYPVQYAAGMETRAKLVLDNWRWEDDYTYLIPSGPMKADTARAGK